MLLGRLVRRPRKGELPGEVGDREGIPVLSLVGEPQDVLPEQVRQAPNRAQPRHVPYESIDMDEMWGLVVTERADLAPEWQRAELCRRALVRLARDEVGLQGRVSWWVYLLGLYVVPLVIFRAWRVLGSEYRWLLRQPHTAPADPEPARHNAGMARSSPPRSVLFRLASVAAP